MVTVKIDGGLGNQMFQYAAARALSLRLKTDLVLDVSAYSEKTTTPWYTARNFDLHHLNITSRILKQLEEKKSRIKKIISKFHKTTLYFERGLNYDSNVTNLSGNVYLEGYFQSEKYFLNIREVLLKEFSCDKIFTGQFNELCNKMKAENAVAVHIRRGDYVSNPFIQSVHGSCTMDYYLEAFRYIESRLNNVTYYFFSDDVEWSMNHLAAERNVTPVSLKGPLSHIAEMHLMSKAKANIIANSSFSWWGAWLNDYPQKMVVAPANWFADPLKNSQTSDLLPDSWIKMK